MAASQSVSGVGYLVGFRLPAKLYAAMERDVDGIYFPGFSWIPASFDRNFEVDIDH